MAVLAAGETDAAGAGTRETELRKSRLRFFILALLTALLLLASIRGHGLAGYDDAVYAHEGKEMARSGDWWSVRFNGHLNYEYPPLFIWLEASSFKLLGVNDFAAKLPSALAGLGTIVVVYFLTLELAGEPWMALLAMFVLASTQFFVKNAGHAMTDVPFTFFFTLAIFFYAKGFYAKGWKSPPYLVLAGVAAALAQLTRPLVGLVALGIIFVHLVWTRRRDWIFIRWTMAGLALALALPGLWYLSQYRLHGGEALGSLFTYLSGKVESRPGGSWWTVLNYPKSLIEYYWPWLPFLLGGVFLELRALRLEWRAPRLKRSETASLLICWVILAFVPLVLVQNRYPRYMMPLFPAFSILAALALDRVIPAKHRNIAFNSVCAVAGVAVAFAFLFPPKARASAIRTLAPIAEANSAADERVIVYSREDLTPDAASEPARSEYLNEFLWYSSRYATLAPDGNDLGARLASGQKAVFIVDKESYGKLLEQAAPETRSRVRMLGQAGDFVCFGIG